MNQPEHRFVRLGTAAWIASACSILVVCIGFLADCGLLLKFGTVDETAPLALSSGGLDHGVLVQRFDNLTLDGPSILTTGSTIALPAGGVPERTSFRFSAYLRIESPGRYGFELTSDDGSQLSLDGIPVVSNWGDHGAVTRSGSRLLSPGYHLLRTDYYQLDKDAVLRVRWKSQGRPYEDIPARCLFIPSPGVVLQDSLWNSSPTANRSPGYLSRIYRDRCLPDMLLRVERRLVVPQIESDPSQARVKDAGPFIEVMTGFVEGKSGEKLTFSVTQGSFLHGQLGEKTWSRSPGPVASSSIEIDVQRTGRQRFELICASMVGSPSSLRVEARNGAVTSVPLVDVSDSPDCRGRPPQEHLLGTKRTPAVHLTDDEEILGPTMHRWDPSRFGLPAHRPPIIATWEGMIKAGPGGPATFTLTGPGTVELEFMESGEWLIKGPGSPSQKKVVSIPAKGVTVKVHVRDPGPVASLRVSWSRSGGDEIPLGNFDTRPPASGSAALMQIGQYLAIIAGALLVICAALGGRGALIRSLLGPGATAIGCGALLLLGALVRLNSYEIVPIPLECADEINYHTAGHQILNGSLPVGWQHVAGAHEVVVPYFFIVLRLTVPFLMYPPLYSTLVGLVSRLGGATDLLHINLHVTRLLPIGLSCFTLLLLYPACRLMRLSRLTSFLAMSWFALDPVNVMAGRLVKDESLLTPLLLLVFMLALSHARKPRLVTRWSICLLVFLAIMTKQMGLGCGVAAFLILCSYEQFAAAGLVGLAMALGVSCFLWWGAVNSWADFRLLQKQLVAESSSADAFWPLLTQARPLERDALHPWLLGAWIFFFMFAVRPRNKDFGLTVIGYLGVLACAYRPSRNFGWYRLPIYPFLSIAWGAAADRLIRKQSAPIFFIFAALFFLPAIDRFDDTAWVARGLVLKAAVLATFVYGGMVGWPNRFAIRSWLSRSMAILLVIVVLGLALGFCLSPSRLVPLSQSWNDPTGLETLPE